ncbi:sensor domain-containing diguanylate cyclase [Massilia niabensis]|uniref:Diguanylate cyclase n=1 Tax=Massilia niabensis TaxID=544910 RepID=A0ABW0L0U5_9BURK
MPTSYTVPALELRQRAFPLLVALALIVGLTIFFVREVVDLRRAMEELRATEAAKVHVRNVLANLLNAETGQRGFLITGDENYLEPYIMGRQDVRNSLRTAEQSDYQSPQYLAAVRKLALLTEKKLDELEHTILLKKRKDDASAIYVVFQGSGRATMREARKTVQTELDRLRLERDHAMQAFDDRLLRAAIILVLILSTVVCIAIQTWRSISHAAQENNDLANRLAIEASHDSLTGLPNKRFFERWAKRLFAKSQREEKTFTLFAIDLDGFKGVNDSLGHAVGDQVLVEAASRLQSNLRAGEFLARLGGDEFGLLIEGDVCEAEATCLGARLIACLSPALHPKLPNNAVGASIGVAAFPVDGEELASVAEAADIALYAAKDNGRGMVYLSKGIVASRLTSRKVKLGSVALVARAA